MSKTQGGHGSMLVGETNKLVGSSNYYIWQLKLNVILRRRCGISLRLAFNLITFQQWFLETNILDKQ
jgi:hypothetical protein